MLVYMLKKVSEGIHPRNLNLEEVQKKAEDKATQINARPPKFNSGNALGPAQVNLNQQREIMEALRELDF